MLDLVAFPDPITSVVAFLNGRGFDASSQIPDRYDRHVLVNCTTQPATMVTRATTYTLEVRNRAGDVEAAEDGSLIASLLEAWARADEGPLSCDINSIVDSFPDPDDGCPRSIVIATIAWQGASRLA